MLQRFQNRHLLRHSNYYYWYLFNDTDSFFLLFIFNPRILSDYSKGMAQNAKKPSTSKSTGGVNNPTILQSSFKSNSTLGTAASLGATGSAEDVAVFTCSENLLQNLQSLFNDTHLSDVTLVVGDKEYPAHKMILATASRCFSNMFYGDWKESTQHKVGFKSVSAQVHYCVTVHVDNLLRHSFFFS